MAAGDSASVVVVVVDFGVVATKNVTEIFSQSSGKPLSECKPLPTWWLYECYEPVICLFVLRLNIPINNFQSCRDGDNAS